MNEDTAWNLNQHVLAYKTMFEKRSELRKFIIVAEAGKIQVAASLLNTTQPALSRVIAKLEADIGAQLFERLPTGVRLTALGETILEQARHLLREFELAESEIHSLVKGHTGTLRVSAGPMWMHSIVPQAVTQFQQAYPGIELQIRTAGYRDGLRLLTNGYTDMHCGGFDSEGPLPEFLNRDPIIDMTLGVVAHAEHPVFSIKNLTYEHLHDYPWLGYDTTVRQASDDEWPSLTTILDELYEKTGRRVQTTVQINSVALSTMMKGPYLTYLGVRLAENFPDLPLKRVPIEFTKREFRSGIVARRSVSQSQIFNQFNRIVRDIVNEFK